MLTFFQPQNCITYFFPATELQYLLFSSHRTAMLPQIAAPVWLWKDALGGKLEKITDFIFFARCSDLIFDCQVLRSLIFLLRNMQKRERTVLQTTVSDEERRAWREGDLGQGPCQRLSNRKVVKCCLGDLGGSWDVRVPKPSVPLAWPIQCQVGCGAECLFEVDLYSYLYHCIIVMPFWGSPIASARTSPPSLTTFHPELRSSSGATAEERWRRYRVFPQRRSQDENRFKLPLHADRELRVYLCWQKIIVNEDLFVFSQVTNCSGLYAGELATFLAKITLVQWVPMFLFISQSKV